MTKPRIEDVLAEPACGVQRFILKELIEGARSTDQLVWGIYRGEEEPDNPGNVIRVSVWRLRKKLRQGWQIVTGPDYDGHTLGRHQRYELRQAACRPPSTAPSS